MLPPSQTRVCNGALADLGESKRITSINDATPLAKLFLQVWDEAIEEVLADHPWNCAVMRESLAISADFTPEGSQYLYAYGKPANLVRWLPHRRDHPDYFDGEEEGDYILSNAEAPVTIRFIGLVDNIAKWSAGMRAALQAKLAHKLAKPITGQTGMWDRMGALYDKRVSDARRQDGAATGGLDRGLQFRSDWLAARQRPWSGTIER